MTFRYRGMRTASKYRLEVSISGKISRESCALPVEDVEMVVPIVVEADSFEELREVLRDVVRLLRNRNNNGKGENKDLFGRTLCLSGQDGGGWADMRSN